MFKQVLQNLPKKEEGSKEESPQSGTSKFNLSSFLGSSSEFAKKLGGNLLLDSGVFSKEATEKIKLKLEDPLISELLNSIEAKNTQRASEIAFDSEFTKKNQKFLQSGKAVTVAVLNEQLEFAKSLASSGYSVPETLLVDISVQGKSSLVPRALELELYQEDYLEMCLWYLVHQDYTEAAEQLLKNFTKLREYTNYEETLSPEAKLRLLRDQNLLRICLNQTLHLSKDELSTALLDFGASLLNKEHLETALQNECLKFLKRIWVDFSEQKGTYKELLQKGVSELQETLKFSEIIKYYLQRKKPKLVEEALQWPHTNREEGVVNILIKFNKQELAQEFIAQEDSNFSPEDFLSAFKEQLYDLCVGMLDVQAARITLNEPKIQETLVELLEKGETCLQAIEMLSCVGADSWHVELTEQLCEVLETFAKKRTEVLICKAPILHCTLVAETMEKFSSASLKYKSDCNSVAEMYKDLGCELENALKEENQLKYYLTQTDFRGRSVLNIFSENKYYKMLDNYQIGVIVSKMWNGSNRNFGILGASTLYNSLVSSSEEALQFTKRVNYSRPYLFQYWQWKESCSLRLKAYAASSILLLVVYTLLLYSAISSNSFSDMHADTTTQTYLWISWFLIGGVLVQHLNRFLFFRKTKREEFDGWILIDSLMFGGAVLAILDTGSVLEDPSMYNACLHSFMTVLVWLKFMGILLTYKEFGPFLRMIYLMFKESIDFFVIFLCLLVFSASVFTALFNDKSYKFPDFFTSMQSLYASALGSIDLTAFTEYEFLGGIFYGAYLLVSNVVLLNLLIAILSNVYEDLSSRVDSEHSAVLIAHYNHLEWSENYGFLNLLPSPFSYFSFASLPFFAFMKDTSKLNEALSKCFYSVFALGQFLVFLTASAVCVPLMYLKGFFVYSKKSKTANSESSQQKIPASGLKLLQWFFIGVPWLTLVYFRDLYDYWALTYQTPDLKKQTKSSKFDQLVTRQFITDIQTTLKGLAGEEVSVKQLLDAWALVDKLHQEKLSTEEDDELVKDFLSRFSNSRKDSTINLERMRRLLPKKQGGLYKKDYLERAKQVNVPSFMKGIAKFQEKVGSMSIGGVNILNNAGGTKVDLRKLEGLERSMRALEENYKQMLGVARNIRSSIEAQFAYLKTRLN